MSAKVKPPHPQVDRLKNRSTLKKYTDPQNVNNSIPNPTKTNPIPPPCTLLEAPEVPDPEGLEPPDDPFPLPDEDELPSPAEGTSWFNAVKLTGGGNVAGCIERFNPGARKTGPPPAPEALTFGAVNGM